MALLAALPACLGVAIATPAVRAAAATTTGELQARASAISAQITADDQRLATLASSYLAASHSYRLAKQKERVDRRAMRRANAALSNDRRSLYSQAIAAYAMGASTTAFGLAFSASADQFASRVTYLNLISGVLSSAEATYKDATTRSAIELTAATNDAATASRSEAQSVAARTSVLAEVSNERSLLSSVNGQLAALIQAQLAAEQAAAAAAAAARAAAAAAPPSPAAAAKAASQAANVPSTLAGAFAAIRNCESGGVYTRNSGNGYYGAYQFSLGTWEGLGEPGLPSGAPPAVQDAAAYRLYQSDGWSPWAECAAIAGL